MLYDFHRVHNTRKPGCLHATYLVAGLRKQLPKRNAIGKQPNGTHSQDEDSPMLDSDLPSSSAPEQSMEQTQDIPSITSVTLVKEEDLESAYHSSARESHCPIPG